MEQKLDCDLTDRKKEIADVIAQYVAENHKDEEDDDDENDSASNSDASESDDEPPPKSKKRAAAPAAKKSAPKPKKKRARSTSSDSGAGSDTATAKKKPAPKAKGKGNSFTRPFKLSPELSSLMNAESLPRHEVVKKVWALIKERNLYDPNNKQFAICDADLMTVIGTKRFRTFGMLKYLKKHFLE